MTDYLKTDSAFSPSNDQLVDALGNFLIADAGTGTISTTTVEVSSLNPSTFGTMVTFTATVTPASGGPPTGTVDFYVGVSLVSSDTLDGAGQATYSVSSLAVGTHDMSVAYLGDGTYDYSDTSLSLVTQVVTAAGSVPSVRYIAFNM